MSGPYAVTKQLEDELCAYTGALYAVAVNSGTAALLLCVEWWKKACWRDGNKYRARIGERGLEVEIPRETYISVPMAIIRAGGWPRWRDEDWKGSYQLKPLPIYDSARRFTSGMYETGTFQCVSFSTTKILGIEQGGAILHDNPEADTWFRKMRFDGRTEGASTFDDVFDVVGHHCIMLPSIAAQLVLKLHHLPKHNQDMEQIPYPDLSKHPAFR